MATTIEEGGVQNDTEVQMYQKLMENKRCEESERGQDGVSVFEKSMWTRDTLLDEEMEQG